MISNALRGSMWSPSLYTNTCWKSFSNEMKSNLSDDGMSVCSINKLISSTVAFSAIFDFVSRTRPRNDSNLLVMNDLTHMELSSFGRNYHTFSCVLHSLRVDFADWLAHHPERLSPALSLRKLYLQYERFSDVWLFESNHWQYREPIDKIANDRLIEIFFQTINSFFKKIFKKKHKIKPRPHCRYNHQNPSRAIEFVLFPVWMLDQSSGVEDE